MKKITKVIDLTYHLYPGKEARHLLIRPISTIAEGKANMFIFEANNHIGTHIESPYHYLSDGLDIEKIPLDRFIGEAAIVDLTCKNFREPITVEDLEKAGKHIKEGNIVILKTEYYRKAKNVHGEEYMRESPYVLPEAIWWLVNRKIKLLGIDFWSIDQYGSPDHSPHTILFENNIPLLENLTNTSELKDECLFIAALPLPISGLDSAPARVLAFQVSE